MRLKGRTAVVTGGARGIGRAYCERLAADGANVVILDREEATGVARGLSIRALRHLRQQCSLYAKSDLASIKSEVWRRVQATNVEAILHFAKQFVPGMKEVGWGRIVATGSSVTLHPQTRDTAYMTSKGSVHALTRALANELADTGITVNSIAP